MGIDLSPILWSSSRHAHNSAEKCVSFLSPFHRRDKEGWHLMWRHQARASTHDNPRDAAFARRRRDVCWLHSSRSRKFCQGGRALRVLRQIQTSTRRQRRELISFPSLSSSLSSAPPVINDRSAHPSIVVPREKSARHEVS
jgi:hypothetical protein